MQILRYNVILFNFVTFYAPLVIFGNYKIVDANTPFTIFQDFKALLMYFSEAFLTGAKFGNDKLEGEMHLVTPKKFIHILNCMESSNSQSGHGNSKLGRIFIFKEQLQAGIGIAELLSGIKRDAMPAEIIAASKLIQLIAVEQLKTMNAIIIPSGWTGHATALTIKNSTNGNDLFDLAFINTGHGLEHHYYKSDPNNVYPHLSRLWLKFKDIPKDLIFDPETAWLFYGLASMRNSFFTNNLASSLNDKKNSSPNYFYDSLLANFMDYFVEPLGENAEEKLFPEQQSGSCTMASLIGALLYFSDSMEDFHWYRLKIGHAFLENFLNRLQPILNIEIADPVIIRRLFRNLLPDEYADVEFMSVLRNAFFSGGARHFAGLMRALANLQLQYLECKFPNEFKNAGLIGSERSTWLTRKKHDAINKLKSDQDTLLELKLTLHLIKSVQKMISDLQYRPETTHIQNLSELHGYFNEKYLYAEIFEGKNIIGSDEASKLKFNVKDGGNIYRNIVEGVPDRLEVEAVGIETFCEFYDNFKSLYLLEDGHKDVYYMIFLDVFRCLRAGSGWSLIHDHRNKDELLSLQEMCKKLAFKFAMLPNNRSNDNFRKATMDEITLLGHLQMLSWNIFRALHNLHHPNNSINWDELIPPVTLQNELFKDLIFGFYDDWPIKGFNDIENYRLYELFIKEDRSVKKSIWRSACNVFPGPEELVSLSEYVYLDQSKLDSFLSDRNLKIIFDKFMNLPEVEIKLRMMKLSPNWAELDETYAKFLIVLSAGQEKLYSLIPHYYNLMYTLHCIRIGARSEGIKMADSYKSENFWLKPIVVPSEMHLALKRNSSKSHYTLFSSKYPLKLFKKKKQAKELFYVLRHSYALPELPGMTDVDTWFNYIKDAKTTKIFDNPYFQYMTDHLLNIPKYNEKGDHENILIFDDVTARKIIRELIKQIRMTLRQLFDDSGKMTPTRRAQIVRRAVNMSVITTRFISRADYEFGNSADPIDWANLLAILYNTIEPYSYLNSHVLKLNDIEVSMLNFALSHMCFTRLRIPDNFTHAIRLGFEYSYMRHRRTLARIHWFIAKLNYTLSANEMIADDQFKYGFLGSPLEKEEIRFFEAVLKEKFLRYYLKMESSEYSYRYESGGYVVEITNHSHESMKILINLATGAIIENGLMLSSKSSFVNSYEFQTYFSLQDQKYLTNAGQAYVMYGVPVFMFPIFKGSDYIMIQYVDKFWLLRKWNNSWYIWRPEEKCSSFFKALKYRWEENPIKLFKKYKTRTKRKVELIIFDEGGKDPILKITQFTALDSSATYYYSSYQQSVPGLTDGISADLISDLEYREMHLGEFAENGITYSRDKSDGTILVVYNNHRLPDDPMKPFVITSSSDNKLWVRNVPNMEICKDQRIGKDGFGLPGCLVASLNGKKILLIPLAEVQKKANIEPYSCSYIRIEKVPMVEMAISQTDAIAIPAPQSRMHKILLAYYFILAQNYDSARRLLHPSTSINHNTIFSDVELLVILCILRIKMEAPEYNALALIAYSHFLINDSKFSFDYTEEASKVVEKVRNNIPSGIFETYLMSIRELPEKYYIFKLFPEILVEDSVLSKAFFTRRENGPWQYSRTPEIFVFPHYLPSGPRTLEFSNRQTIRNMVDLLDQGSNLTPDFKLIKYLIIRNRSSERFDTGFEMAMYCYLSNPDLWNQFKSELGQNGSNLDSEKKALEKLFTSTLAQCKFHKYFNGISLARISESTDLKKIQETMRKDSGIFEEYKSETSNHLITIDIEEEKLELLSFKSRLMESIRESGSYLADGLNIGFDPALIRSSTVLGNLSISIGSFVTEKGINHVTGFNFNSDESLLSGLQNLSLIVSRRIDALEREQNTLSDALIDETYPSVDDDSKYAHALEKLFANMHQRKRKTFSDLYACYLKDSLSCIQRKFPQLDKEQCEQVQTDSILFFSQSIFLNYLNSLQNSIDIFLNSSSIAVDDLLIFCNELEKISDLNERIKNPIIMNFEFRSTKYRLKAEQVKDIELLTNVGLDNNFKSVVIQRMMAAGKTLVLGTISVVMKALKRNDRLSILVPPSSLYQSNTTATQTRTYQYFKKKGYNFNVPRLPLPSDKEMAQKISDFLDNIISIINHTIESRNYLILSPDHLQSFLNSYIEAIEGAKVLCTSDNIKILKKFAIIYKIFKEKSSIILDEIDMTMDPKKELNFPTIDTETYNMTAVAMIADIIEFMLFDKSIKDAGLNIYSNNQAALTPENYVKCRGIVLDYIKSQLQDEKSLWRKLVPENAAAGAMNFLKRKKISGGMSWIISAVKGKHATLAKALVIVKTQIYLHFEEFLGATVNQNYGSAGGLRPNIKYAVPYVAANTPSAGSVFADRWETLVKTILMISVSPCSIETARDVIIYVRKSIAAESAGVTEFDVKLFPTFINLSHILPENIDILTLDENEHSHVAIVHDALNSRSPAAIRILYSYYINEILAKMEFPVEQITSNALHMTSMFASIQGYSGTIDNVNILPQRVVAEALFDHEENEKNNGGIALKLIQDFDNEIIPELGEKSFTLSAIEMVQSFFEVFVRRVKPIDKISAIIDTGAFFKNFKNRAVAEAILKYFSGTMKSVLYYDEASNHLEFISGVFDAGNLISTTIGFLETTDPDDIERTTHAKIYERFTFYDQRHITGSDILQPKFAHAIMTAGPRILLRDLLQGTLRMRQFMTSQKVHLIITESIRKFYNSKINEKKENICVSDLITLGSLNEDDKQNHENEKLAFAKIDAEIRSFLLDEISNLLVHGLDFYFGVIIALYSDNRDLFVRSIREDPISWLRDKKPQNTVSILEQHVKLRLEKVNPFFRTPEKAARLDKLKEKLGIMCKAEYKNNNDSLLKYLKEEIHVRNDETIGTEVVLQSQVHNLTLMDLDLDQLVEQKETELEIKEHKFNLLYSNYRMVRDGSVHSSVDDFHSLKVIFDDQPLSRQELVDSVLLTDGSQIGVTSDLLQLYTATSASSSLFPIFSKYTMEGSHLLVYALPSELNDPKVLLLSPRHAASVFNGLKSSEFINYLFWLCNLSGDVMITNQSANSVFNIMEWGRFLYSIFSNLKFGSSHLKIESKTNIFKMKEFGPNLVKLIFDLLIFNGSLPQILANSKLRDLYENEWIKAGNFKNRALFLRMRMKALAEKDSIMFDEDDEDYRMLKKYSSGDSKRETKVEKYTDGYPKSAITNEFQKSFAIKANNQSFISTNNVVGFNPEDIKKKMAEIFVGRLCDANDESFLNLIEMKFVPETKQPEIDLNVATLSDEEDNCEYSDDEMSNSKMAEDSDTEELETSQNNYDSEDDELSFIDCEENDDEIGDDLLALLEQPN